MLKFWLKLQYTFSYLYRGKNIVERTKQIYHCARIEFFSNYIGQSPMCMFDKLHLIFNIKSKVSGDYETNFWLSPSQIRQFVKFNEIHLANGLYPMLGAAVRGYRRQELVMASN